ARVPVPVETGFERDHVAGDQGLALDPADTGTLVHLEADAVTGRVEIPVHERLALLLVELRLVAVLVEEIADLAMDVASLHAGLDRSNRHVERLFREPVVLPQLV